MSLIVDKSGVSSNFHALFVAVFFGTIFVLFFALQLTCQVLGICFVSGPVYFGLLRFSGFNLVE